MHVNWIIMRRILLLFSIVLLSISALSQNTSPLKMLNFRKLPNELVDLKALKQETGRDCDFDSNVAALIRVKAQGFSEQTMLDFSPSPRSGIEIIHKKYTNNELWLYVSSNCQGTIMIKYMGEFEFKLPNKLEPKSVYELILGMETATLVINAVPSTAEIYIDGKKVGTGYGSAAVSVGSEHRYKVVCEGYIPEEDMVKTEKAEKIERQIELRPNFGFITIKSDPTGADVFIDDVKVGVTPYQMKKITPGTHVVELRKTGFESLADMVVIKAGEVNRQFENVKLTALQVSTGSLEITSNPAGAIVTINGRQYGQTPQTLTNLEIGTYIVDFSKEGYQNLSQTVTVKEGKKETLAVTMSKANVQQQQVVQTPVTPTTPTVQTTSSFIDGQFSVSANEKVYFSKGNLQYQASTKTWRFAEHQWDIIGSENSNISESYSGWIDLFGWGTSGYNGNNPWMTSYESSDYGNGERDIAGTNYDWGVNNTISNGGGKRWRTLTGDEWVYLFNKRSTSSGIRYAMATVNGVNGVILLPDNWSSSNYSLSNTNKTDASFSSNRISKSDWTSKFESNGAVFLPAAGHRNGTYVDNVGSCGYYWSASYSSSVSAYYVWFSDGSLGPDDWGGRDYGRSVRLVCSAEN